MDKEILEILKEMQKDMQEIKLEIKEINKKLDGITDQTANLTEFRTTVEEVTKANCYEIAKLKIVK